MPVVSRVNSALAVRSKLDALEGAWLPNAASIASSRFSASSQASSTRSSELS